MHTIMSEYSANHCSPRTVATYPDWNLRRTELAHFLRNRRAALTPQRAGLPSRGRRRTPGLRREEVAELAGISAGLYSWLEQGRDVSISRRTIDSICKALQLSRPESEHATSLAERYFYELDETISQPLFRFVESLHSPMFVVNHLWDISLHNQPANELFRFEQSPGGRRNLIEHVRSRVT